MATYYTTKDGDMLDWICWQHYGQGARLMQAAYALDPRLAEASSDLTEQVLSLAQFGSSRLERVVEQVLDANPGLANRGLVLSAGTRVYLPDITPEVKDTWVVRLWDE
jgi:phage tail protein X